LKGYSKDFIQGRYTHTYEWEKEQQAIWRNKPRLLNQRANRQLVKSLELLLEAPFMGQFMSDLVADLKYVI